MDPDNQYQPYPLGSQSDSDQTDQTSHEPADQFDRGPTAPHLPFGPASSSQPPQPAPTVLPEPTVHPPTPAQTNPAEQPDPAYPPPQTPQVFEPSPTQAPGADAAANLARMKLDQAYQQQNPRGHEENLGIQPAQSYQPEQNYQPEQTYINPPPEPVAPEPYAQTEATYQPYQEYQAEQAIQDQIEPQYQHITPDHQLSAANPHYELPAQTPQQSFEPTPAPHQQAQVYQPTEPQQPITDYQPIPDQTPAVVHHSSF